MNRNEIQDRAIEVLTTFNNSISTSRMYPPEAPQVTAAVERGYKSLKTFLRKDKRLQFSLIADVPYLAGAPLHQYVLDSFANLHIYRQLRVLGLTTLTVTADMDRFTFNQLLGVFHASVAKIKDAGGGLEFITSQGLAGYFSDAPPVDSAPGASGKAKDRNLLKVRPELVACLLGTDKRPLVLEDLKKRIAIVDTGVTILAAAIARILKAIRGKKKIMAAAEFNRMLRSAEPLIPAEKKDTISKNLAELLIGNMKESALCVLLCQDFSGSFGRKFYANLVNSLSGEQLGEVVVVFREKLRHARALDAEAPQVQLIGKAMLKLMTTDRGKKFLSDEKARSIIHKGEKERLQKRFESGVASILSGDYQVLESEELLQALPAGLLDMEKKAEGGGAVKVLKHLIKHLGTGHDIDKRALLKCLLAIGESFLASKHFSTVRILVEPFILVVKKTSLGSQLFEDIVVFLQTMMQACWKSGDLTCGDTILLLFFKIRSGQIEKSDQQKNLVAQVQDRGIERANLPLLLDQCLANPDDEDLSYRLVLQGPVAIRFLVNALIQTEESADRLKIIDLLSNNSRYLGPIILERLPEHMPWYGKRNLLKLLGETGREEDADAALGYLRHPDYRVQREAFLCIYKIGRMQRKRLFLEALDIASEPVKIQLVEAFGSFCDQEVAQRLSAIMADYETYSETNRESLLLALIGTFGRCPCSASVKAIQGFLQLKEERETKNVSARVWEAAEKTMHFLKSDMQAMKKKHVQASQLRKSAMKHLSQKSKPALGRRVITGLPEEQTIRNLLSKGEKNEAVSKLLLFIEQIARKKNFLQADQLKEWLAEIDKNDPANILRAVDIIAKEKIATIDKSHLEVWSELYDALSTEEFSTVFESLQHRKYSTEERIVEQGAIQSALFFVNSGEVKLYYKDEGNEFYIATAKSGEIFGADAFFEPSVWTMSVASVGLSEVSLLPVEILQQWNTTHPELEEKLLNFCSRFERVESLIIKQSRERRLHKRHTMSCKVEADLIDSRGRATGISDHAEMLDISLGGLSYIIKVEHKGDLRQLLGRKMRMQLFAGGRLGETVVMGDIVAVKKIKEANGLHSVHIKLDTLLSSQLIYEIIQANRVDSSVESNG